jgi:hypothetical protein
VYSKVVSALVFVTVLACQPQDDLLRFQNKDLVEIVLKNGRAFKGVITESNPDHITLDLSADNPKLRGTVTLDRVNIKSERKIKRFDEKTIAKLREERDKALQALAQAEAERKSRIEKEEKERRKIKDTADNEKRKEKDKGDLQSEQEKLKQLNEGYKLLEKFDPDIWGPKYSELLTKFIRTGAALSDEEKEFLDNYETWKLARDHRNESNRKLNDGLGLLKEFPSDEWGEAKYNEIEKKLSEGAPLSEQERKFYKNYDLWKIGKEHMDAQEKKSQEEPKK